MTVTAKNRRRGRAASSGGMFGNPADRGLLDLPEAQPVIARLAAQVCEFSTVDRAEHVLLVAAVAVKAKRHPTNAYAKPTL